ncbi:MAG: polyphosphate polymerase domain-containing protein [Lachnospiraceae bacterium]|nr:polyphosphate polymerase domain-containing protein [Lachnospiraceae bacterium]
MNEVLRQEKKYLISLDQMYAYSQYFGGVMMQDAHNGAEGYAIRSLYFDTLENRDFEEKENGLALRRKIRLRCYDAADSFAMLEMKQKQGAMQKKRSLRMKREDAMQLVRGEYGVLLSYEEAFARECYAVMNMHCYRPRAVVEYRRKAFIAKENKIRITFDHQIKATESNMDLFSAQLVQNTVLDTYLAVLEVKYNGFLLSYIKDLLQCCDSSELSVSKYCLSRSVSTHYRF